MVTGDLNILPVAVPIYRIMVFVVIFKPLSLFVNDRYPLALDLETERRTGFLL
jgi:hypothetical protein